jgi:hypothetical protein
VPYVSPLATRRRDILDLASGKYEAGGLLLGTAMPTVEISDKELNPKRYGGTGKIECDRDELAEWFLEEARKSGKCRDVQSIGIQGPFENRDPNWSFGGDLEISDASRAALQEIRGTRGRRYMLVDGRMPRRSKHELEAKSLVAARKAQGCGDLQAVEIIHVATAGTGPNWAPLKFDPPLPAMAQRNAWDAIAAVMQRYALDD